MTQRQLRRAAERKAQKQARKAAGQIGSTIGTSMPLLDDTALPCNVETCLDVAECPEHLSFEPEAPERSPISAAQLAANRANSKLSTGPTSREGKSKSSLNAVKTALTGRTVLLPTDEAAEYECYIQAYEKELRPIGQRECDLVQSIADIGWRLNRIPGLQMAIFVQGSIQFADSFDDHDRSLRPGLIELHTFLAYEKQLRNLQLQEARLARRREKENAELRQLQQERSKREAEDLEDLSKLYLAAKHDKKPFDPASYGFEFSVHDVECYLEGAHAAEFARQTRKQERDQQKRHLQAA